MFCAAIHMNMYETIKTHESQINKIISTFYLPSETTNSFHSHFCTQSSFSRHFPNERFVLVRSSFFNVNDIRCTAFSHWSGDTSSVRIKSPLTLNHIASWQRKYYFSHNFISNLTADTTLPYTCTTPFFSLSRFVLVHYSMNNNNNNLFDACTFAWNTLQSIGGEDGNAYEGRSLCWCCGMFDFRLSIQRKYNSDVNSVRFKCDYCVLTSEWQVDVSGKKRASDCYHTHLALCTWVQVIRHDLSFSNVQHKP